MIGHLVCLVVFVAVYFAAIRPLRKRITELEKTFAANEVRNNGLHRIRKSEITALRRLSGEEAEAISERLDRIETRPTVVE